MTTDRQQGVVYLIPTLLGGDDPQRCIPSYNILKIGELRCFVVEEIRSARRFLRKLIPDFPIDDCLFHTLNEHSQTLDSDKLLQPIKEGKSIGDLQMQLDFLWSEIQGYKTVLNTLKTATSVKAASDSVLTGYERPADQGDAVKAKRAGYGQGYYDKYAKAETPAQTDTSVPFLVRVSITDLNIRKGPGTNYARTGKYTGKGVFTIVATSSGQGSTAGWGKLKSGVGWICLDYAVKI